LSSSGRPGVEAAADVYSGMAGLNGLGAPFESLRTFGPAFLLSAALGLLIMITQSAPNSWQLVESPRGLAYTGALGLLVGAALITLAEPSPFLYFQF
jgi:hypothetical protein